MENFKLLADRIYRLTIVLGYCDSIHRIQATTDNLKEKDRIEDYARTALDKAFTVSKMN
jgi:hypothetical protein